MALLVENKILKRIYKVPDEVKEPKAVDQSPHKGNTHLMVNGQETSEGVDEPTAANVAQSMISEECAVEVEKFWL